jgi:hypothetical protein
MLCGGIKKRKEGGALMITSLQGDPRLPFRLPSSFFFSPLTLPVHTHTACSGSIFNSKCIVEEQKKNWKSNLASGLNLNTG